MKQFEKTGLIAHQRLTGGSYDDFIGSPEYHDAMNQILDAQASFEALPAKIRARFGNDPAAFLDFAQNPDNSDELIRMGLATPIPSDPPEDVPLPLEPDSVVVEPDLVV